MLAQCGRRGPTNPISTSRLYLPCGTMREITQHSALPTILALVLVLVPVPVPVHCRTVLVAAWCWRRLGAQGAGASGSAGTGAGAGARARAGAGPCVTVRVLPAKLLTDTRCLSPPPQAPLPRSGVVWVNPRFRSCPDYLTRITPRRGYAPASHAAQPRCVDSAFSRFSQHRYILGALLAILAAGHARPVP